MDLRHNVECKTVKLLNQSIEENWYDLGFSDESLHKMQKHYTWEKWCWILLKLKTSAL